MSCNVFANGNEVACKAGSGKVICAFPDVCLSPPSPPAGPLPVPYPDTSFAKDTQKGSKTVKIKRKPVMLKDQSFYKSSPLGNEAATRSFGAGVVTHQTTGKTYFVMWSFDVQAEGKNLPRHIDPTTSNHRSMIGNAMLPMINAATMALAWFRRIRGKCECCGKAPHATSGSKISMDNWYTTGQSGATRPDLNNGFTTNSGDYVRGYAAVVADAKNKKNLTPPCTCSGDLLPKPPCDKFFTGVNKDERKKIAATWDAAGRKGDGMFTIRRRIGAKAGEQVNHLTPKSAGGCPTGKGNLQAHEVLCQTCKDLDIEFGKLQSRRMQL